MNHYIEDLIFTCREIYATACIPHYIDCENTLFTEDVIQICKTYTETPIRCYIGIASCILTDSYRMNKREYVLHVFLSEKFL